MSSPVQPLTAIRTQRVAMRQQDHDAGRPARERMDFMHWLRTTAIIGCMAALAPAAGAPRPAAPAARANPFATPSNLPFQAPPFDRIKDSDYQPAFEQAMAEQAAEISAIANNPAPPTFDNTIAAMERSGRMLDRVNNAFSGVVGANTNPTLDKVQEIETPKLTQHQDAIYLNPKLFARVQALYRNRGKLGLDAEQKQLLEIYREQFIRAGA